jgi:hypothetical protein
MKKPEHVFKRQIRTVLATLAVGATYAISASAVTLPFTQKAGFYAGATDAGNGYSTATTLLMGDNGGLDFFTAVPSSLTEIYKYMGWGCNSPSHTNCAGGDSPANQKHVPPLATNPWGNSNRSALSVEGGPGPNLTDAAWTDITIIQHQNNVILGNFLEYAEVHSLLTLGGGPPLDGPGGSVTGVDFFETLNYNTGTIAQDCIIQPIANAPVNPLGTRCDDFAFVSGLDLTPLGPIIVGGLPYQVKFNLATTNNATALVCPGKNFSPQDARCKDSANVTYNGDDFLIYTAEGGTNQFSIQAKLVPIDIQNPFPTFVVGDCEYDQAKLKKNETPPPDNNIREVLDVVNFWGAQWWKNNCMSSFVDNGYPAFKGFATNVQVNLSGTPNCGKWQARPGNSGHPPDTLPDVIDIIVTDNVIKDGPNISGNIKQIVRINRKTPNVGDKYAGNPGHAGYGTINQVLCGPTS